jgi:hypothetical protein
MAAQNEYIKIIFFVEKSGVIGAFQITYGDSQMQSSQIHDVKYIADLPKALTQEISPEKSLFYGALLMLATNHPDGMEAFIEKNGVKFNRNKTQVNEEKLALLKSYKEYLVNTKGKGKGEAESPLNPPDPEERTKVIALFKSNTYTRSPNVELIKIGSEFFWKADWKNLQGLFTNEERRLKKFDYKNQDGEYSLEVSEFTLFNGINELPKFIEIKSEKGLNTKIQIIAEEVGNKKEKDFEELKKKAAGKKDTKETLGFLF